MDMKKCQGCVSCMMACSLVHHGAENLSLSRIQVLQNPQGSFPDDLYIAQCRQCVKPACEKACPTGACKRETPEKPVLVNGDLCDARAECVEACPFDMMFMSADGKVAVKCDLCPERLAEGKLPACVEACPTSALRYDDGTETKKDKEKVAV